MRAAAKFSRKIANPHHAHFVAILFSEQRHGVILVNGLFDWYIRNGLDDLIAQHFFIDDVFHVLQFFVFDRSEVREIKAQMVRRNQRSRLFHMLAEHLAQPGMKQMRSSVVAHGGFSSVGIHHRIHSVADADRLFRDDLMRPHALNRRIASSYFCDDGIVVVRVEPSLIAKLAARVGVERSEVEDDLAGFSGFEFARTLTVMNDG